MAGARPPVLVDAARRDRAGPPIHVAAYEAGSACIASRPGRWESAVRPQAPVARVVPGRRAADGLEAVAGPSEERGRKFSTTTFAPSISRLRVASAGLQVRASLRCCGWRCARRRLTPRRPRTRRRTVPLEGAPIGSI